MEELPIGWKRCKLGDFISLRNGYAFKSGDFSSEGIPVIRISDIQDGQVTPDESVRVPKQKAKAGFSLERGDVLVAMSGATTGKIGRYTSDTPALQNQRVGNLVPKDRNISKDFIYYWIQIHKKDIEEQAYGGAQPNISSKLIEQIDTRLPPLPEQKRIVAKLDTLFAHLDQLRARLDKIPALLKQFRQAVLTQAVTGKLTEEWSAISLGELGEWYGGGTPSKNNSKFWNASDIHWITPKDMKGVFINNSMDKISSRAQQQTNLSLVKPDSILIVVRSGILRRVLPVAINTVETTINQDLKAITVGDKFDPRFILYSLIGREQDIRYSCMKSGTTVESVESSLLKNYSLKVPLTIERQREVVVRIESLFASAEKIEAGFRSIKENIERLPQAILSKAFHGKLITDHFGKQLRAYNQETQELLRAAEPKD